MFFEFTMRELKQSSIPDKSWSVIMSLNKEMHFISCIYTFQDFETFFGACIMYGL